ncbi:MAG: hypothetical protein NVS9B15_17400 [Acidobacteriaceae bacterium]
MIASRADLSEELWEHFRTLMEYRLRTFCSQPFPREVSLPQIHVLMLLHHQGDTTLSDLARAFCVSAPSASSLVDRMEEHQLVQRVRDTDDRRIVYVRASERGTRIVEEMMGMQREQIQRMLNAMTDDEMRDLVRGLAAVRRAAERMQHTPE